MNAIKKLIMLAMFATVFLPVLSQERPDTVYLFRFVPGQDMFYVPWNGNDKELERLETCVSKYKERILAGEIPLRVDGYCVSAGNPTDNLRMAKARSNRVKSELITRQGLTEECFITRNHAEKGDFVTVRIVVPRADITSMTQERPEEKEEETIVPPVKEEKKEVVRQEEPQTTQETQPEEILPVIKNKDEETYTLALRTNLLRWATLTSDLGIEWRINSSWGIVTNGSWTSWTWNDKDRRYALWEVSSEMRYYIGKGKRGYIGAMYKAGQFNYKLSATGKQGDLMGGGITGGYGLRLNNALSLDFNLGIGCVRADYEKYEVIDGVRVRRDSEKKDWWGPINAGVTLMWNLF